MWIDISENYQASSEGHVRNKRTGYILREFVGKDGYLRTQFDGKTRTLHRVVANAFIEKVPGKEFVNHKDGVKTNNNVRNLEWCTKSENQLHAISYGLRKRPTGTLNPRCKLTPDDVEFIRNNYIRGDQSFGCKALAEKYGVAHQTISAVITKQNWKDTSVQEKDDDHE